METSFQQAMLKKKKKKKAETAITAFGGERSTLNGKCIVVDLESPFKEELTMNTVC